LVVAVVAAAATAAIVIAMYSQPSDEEQIRAVITGIETAENRNDDDALKRYSCKDVPFSLLHELGADDLIGVDAPMTLEFVRKDDTWKACGYDITRK
jgi:hypothetical protein